MLRFDRLLGILLFLRSGKSVSASDLARRFNVSARTIFRDLETLSALGVPLYAERGRTGGFKLLEGYFLPPLTFSQSEAIALLLGVTLQKNLRATLFPREMVLAEKKLLAALPERIRAILERAEQVLGVEKLPADIFHPDTGFPLVDAFSSVDEERESRVVSLFCQAILDGNAVVFRYPARRQARIHDVQAWPLGLFWDRDHWYLVGRAEGREGARTWRSDRVLTLRSVSMGGTQQQDFDVRAMLGHTWLQTAMEEWRQQAPVRIRLTSAQADRLRRDWYYRHAHFEQLDADKVLMTFGESNATLVLELLRWLGPGAELLEPLVWRQKIKEELRQMLEYYTVDGPE